MINKKSKKSVSSGNSRSKKPTDKGRRLAMGKVVVRGVKARPGRVKAARPANQSASKPMNISTQRKAGTGKASTAARSMAVSPQFEELDRGRRLRLLHEQGLSLAEVARKFGCSKSLVRDLVLLANLSNELEENYLQGKLGRKAVLRMARAVRRRAREKAAATREELQKNPQQESFSEAEVNAIANRDQNPSPEATVAFGIKEPKKGSGRSSPPIMTKEEREKRVTENATLIIDWFHSVDLAPCYWDDFFEQVKLGLYGSFHWLFSAEAPQPNEIRPDEEPWKVIKRSKVERKNPQFVTDIINDLVTWLARWIQRVIPDRKMMEDAFYRARRQLLRESRMAHWV